MTPQNLDRIRNSFDSCDQPLLCEPDLKKIDWGDLDYLSWFHPSGKRAFLCAEFEEVLIGLVFRLHGSPGSNGSSTGICHLCLSGDLRSGTRMVLVDSMQKPRRSYGIHVCYSLDCSDAVRGKRQASALRETIPNGQKIERFQARLAAFLTKISYD